MSNFGTNSVIDLSIYDGFGKYITTFNTVKDYRIDNGFLFVTEALFNSDFMKLVGNNVKENSVNLGSSENKKLSLVGNGYFRDAGTAEDIPFSISFPNVEYNTEQMEWGVIVESGDPTTVPHVFKLNPFNEDGDRFVIESDVLKDNSLEISSDICKFKIHEDGININVHVDGSVTNKEDIKNLAEGITSQIKRKGGSI